MLLCTVLGFRLQVLTKSSLGLVRHIFQLCLPRRSLVQNKSKLFDPISQLSCVQRGLVRSGPLNPFFFFWVNGNITIFCGMIES